MPKHMESKALDSDSLVGRRQECLDAPSTGPNLVPTRARGCEALIPEE